MKTAQISTDAGPAYIKALGNPEGPHPLACELVATHLARWFGLQTFDFAILRLDESDEIPFPGGGSAKPGPAFVTKAEKGHPWGGEAEELTQLSNREDISRLVIFDTWTLNCDRQPPPDSQRKRNLDNVFLSHEGAGDNNVRLIAMDHSHCFTCGRDLTERVGEIDRIKDERVFGVFPGFRSCFTRDAIGAGVKRLVQFDEETCQGFVESIPTEWEVSSSVRSALCRLIEGRAAFLADNLKRMLKPLLPLCGPQNDFEFSRDGEKK